MGGSRAGMDPVRGVMKLAVVALSLLVLWPQCSGQNVARLLSSQSDASNQTYVANYDSVIFGGTVTVSVTATGVVFSTLAPDVLQTNASGIPPGTAANESFLVPPSGASLTSVNHITVFYQPNGVFPYPMNNTNPALNQSLKAACPSCWYYISFFFIPISDALALAPNCTTELANFCDSGNANVPGSTFQSPSAALLPSSFSASAGDLPQVLSTAVKNSGTILPVTQTLAPLSGLQLGQFWVSSALPPQTSSFNGTTVLCPENYYLTNAGQVVGVGQVVGAAYFGFFSSFFNANPNLVRSKDTTGPFAAPSSYGVAGNYPQGASSQVYGFQGTTTFAFGFVNTSSFTPSNTNKRANSLVLSLPWLVASVWMAGALVLMFDHL